MVNINEPEIFSKKILKLLNNDADQKKPWSELDEFVPEIMELTNRHVFGGKMQNRVVKWKSFEGDDKTKAAITYWNNSDFDRVTEIVLNTRVVTTKARLVEVLLHELQ